MFRSLWARDDTVLYAWYTVVYLFAGVAVRGNRVNICDISSSLFSLWICGIFISFALDLEAISRASHSFGHSPNCTYWRSTVLTTCNVHINE